MGIVEMYTCIRAAVLDRMELMFYQRINVHVSIDYSDNNNECFPRSW